MNLISPWRVQSPGMKYPPTSGEMKTDYPKAWKGGKFASEKQTKPGEQKKREWISVHLQSWREMKASSEGEWGVSASEGEGERQQPRATSFSPQPRSVARVKSLPLTWPSSGCPRALAWRFPSLGFELPAFPNCCSFASSPLPRLPRRGAPGNAKRKSIAEEEAEKLQAWSELWSLGGSGKELVL